MSDPMSPETEVVALAAAMENVAGKMYRGISPEYLAYNAEFIATALHAAGFSVQRAATEPPLRDRIAEAVWGAAYSQTEFVCRCDPDATCWPHEEADAVLAAPTEEERQHE